MKDTILRAASLIGKSSNCAVLTGAGISVESGIPAFRGHQGLWEKYDPAEFVHIVAFRMNPEKVWNMLGEMMSVLFEAKPTFAHFALAELEKMGIVSRVITQNIDGLHQMAGSCKVIEYHGNARNLACLDCRETFDSEEKLGEGVPPLCTCGSILKPDVVFFGEPIPKEAAASALDLARESDLFMVVGTSGTVAPANQLPFIALERGVPVIIINPERIELSAYPGTLWVEGTATGVLKNIIETLESRTEED